MAANCASTYSRRFAHRIPFCFGEDHVNMFSLPFFPRVCAVQPPPGPIHATLAKGQGGSQLPMYHHSQCHSKTQTVAKGTRHAVSRTRRSRHTPVEFLRRNRRGAKSPPTILSLDNRPPSILEGQTSLLPHVAHRHAYALTRHVDDAHCSDSPSRDACSRGFACIPRDGSDRPRERREYTLRIPPPYTRESG